jgi:hypothetical protein
VKHNALLSARGSPTAVKRSSSFAAPVERWFRRTSVNEDIYRRAAIENAGSQIKVLFDGNSFRAAFPSMRRASTKILSCRE